MNNSLKETANHSQVIIHIDADCFYAQVEMIRNPTLRDKPIGIQQKNLMVTCNYLARSLGVKKTMWAKDALKILPNLILIDGSDLTPYRRCSTEILSLLQTYTKMVEKLGLDENFIDVTDILDEYSCTEDLEIKGHIHGVNKEENRSFKDPCDCGCFRRLIIGSYIAEKMRYHIHEMTGITTCAGVGHNKVLAKLVSGHHKPNDQTIVFPSQVENVMNSLKVRDIPGIGATTYKMLESLGITKIEELQSCPLKVLNEKFDSDFSLRLKKLSHGIDDSFVRSSGPPQTLSIEDAFKKVTTFEEVKKKFEILIDRLLKLLIEDGRFPSCLRVTVRKHGNEKHFSQRETRHSPLSSSLFGSADKVAVLARTKIALKEVVLKVFSKIVDVSKPFHLTLLGVGFIKFYDRAPSSQSISHFFKKYHLEDTLPMTKKMKLNEDSVCLGKDFSDSSSENSFNFVTTETASPNKANFDLESGTKMTTELKSTETSTGQIETPAGFDSDVWNSLPEDLKKEVSQSPQLWKSHASVHKQNFSNKEYAKRSPLKSKSIVKKKSPSNQKRIQSFFSVVPKSKTEAAIQSSDESSSSVKPDLPFQVVKSYSERTDGKPLKAESNSSMAEMSNKATIKQLLTKKGISLDVFEELPQDIREEILANL